VCSIALSVSVTFASGMNWKSAPVNPASGLNTSVIHFGKSDSKPKSRGNRVPQGVNVRVMANLLCQQRRAGHFVVLSAGAAIQELMNNASLLVSTKHDSAGSSQFGTKLDRCG
jgi:hypothetical protein